MGCQSRPTIPRISVVTTFNRLRSSSSKQPTSTHEASEIVDNPHLDLARTTHRNSWPIYFHIFATVSSVSR
jgi:hypothetical protein